MSKTLEAIHPPPVGSKPVASKFLLGPSARSFFCQLRQEGSSLSVLVCAYQDSAGLSN